MSALFVSESDFFSEAAEVVRLFSNEKHIESINAPVIRSQGFTYHVKIGSEGSVAAVFKDGRKVAHATDETRFRELQRSAPRSLRRQRKHQAKHVLYRALSAYWERSLPWGSLTGIRPTKLYRELSELYGRSAARDELQNAYDVSAERTALADDILGVQESLLACISRDATCVYIGIPYCPTRCRYCSFVAQDIAGAREARDIYLRALIRDMEAFRTVFTDAVSVYVGGGTPTTLNAFELEQLLEKIAILYPKARELTVEAGRPDTIDRKKLELCRAYGVNRISINPQTANDATLRTMGRAHTVSDFRSAIELAMQLGFDHINTDMIIGLPGETLADIEATLDLILSYQPTSVTAHALAVKKGADLAASTDWRMMAPEAAAQAAAYVRSRLASCGYLPYYLYRQKYMSGNLENTGYAKTGGACLYNVLHMEELASIAAFGAAAVSKRIFSGERRIERVDNVKNAKDYVERLEEMIDRKRQLFSIE